MIDFKALGAKAAAEGRDMTQAQKGGGGGDYTPPAAGFVKLRFIGYIEVGKHEKTFKGQSKVSDRVLLTFELSGPKHQPKVTEDGEKLPFRITIEENLSLNEKANFFKLFTRMNYAGKARHMAELLGEAYVGTIFHDKWTGKDGKERIDAVLRDPADGSYSIRPPRRTDEETGDEVVISVDPAISPVRCFLWSYADKAQWDSLYIDGEYPERRDDKGNVTAPARSKNVLQNKIRSAKNFEGSLAHQIAGGGALELPEPEQGRDALSTESKPKATGPAGLADPLDDIPV